MIRAGFQLFQSSTTAMGSVEPIPDGESIPTQERSSVQVESSSEESVELASDDGRYEGTKLICTSSCPAIVRILCWGVPIDIPLSFLGVKR